MQNRASQIILIAIVILLSISQLSHACTIGVASGQVTSNGRALLWKTRDIASYPENYLQWNDQSQLGFLYVRDIRDGLAWMGVNENGFCLANSYVQRPASNRPIFNNGSLIYHLLGNCSTIDDMDAILDTLDISSQVLSGNFGVIDSTGNAAIYEISWTEVIKYNASEAEDGFLIRTNFSLISGGSDGMERYLRSNQIITELIGDENLNAASIIQFHMRDFSDDNSQPVPVPFTDRWFFDRPWGYIKTNDSICRGIAASSSVFESVLPGEPVNSTTMFTLLGNPATSVFLPLFPIGEPPHQTTANTGMQITQFANNIKSLIFDLPDNAYYLDSYNLIEPGEERIFDRILPYEQLMINATEEFMIDWRYGNSGIDEAEIFSQYWTDQAVMLLESLPEVISHQPIPDFSANITTGGYPLSVIFNDQTRHNPSSLQWDFDNNYIIDAVNTFTPNWIYNEPGTYTVRLIVSNEHDTTEIIKSDFIQVNQTPVSLSEISNTPLILTSYPNPFKVNSRTHFANISFFLPEPASYAKIDIFNQRGRKIVSKLFSDTLATGEHTWNWDGRDHNGNITASGVYIYRLKIPGYKYISRKMTIIR